MPERSVSATARQLAEKIANITNEVVESFALDSIEKRVQVLRDKTSRILIDDMLPVSLWLERRRPPDKVELLRRRIHMICDEAIACVTMEIPEFAGGIRPCDDVTERSAGCIRTATLAVTAILIAQSISEWADEIQSEESRDTPTIEVAIGNPIIKSLVRCRERLVTDAEKYRALGAILVHTTELGNKPEPNWPDQFVAQGKHQLNLGSGPYCDMNQLFDGDGKPAVGTKPVVDKDGKPMVYSDGSPIAFYPGARRSYSLYGDCFHGSSPINYSEAVREYMDTANELGQLLNDSPTNIKAIIWRDWPYGYKNFKAADLWTNAVFELAWQNHSGSGLGAERWVWHKNTKIKVEDLPETIREGSPLFGMFRNLFEHAGNPPLFWYSWLTNLWRSSLSAIGIILEMLLQSSSDIASAMTPEIVGPSQVSAASILKEALLNGFGSDAAVNRIVGNRKSISSTELDEIASRLVRQLYEKGYTLPEIKVMPLADVDVICDLASPTGATTTATAAIGEAADSKLAEKVAKLERAHKSEQTPKEKLKQQRIKFIHPRREKNEPWSKIFTAYLAKYPNDPWCAAETREDAMRVWYGNHSDEPTKATK